MLVSMAPGYFYTECWPHPHEDRDGGGDRDGNRDRDEDGHRDRNRDGAKILLGLIFEELGVKAQGRRSML